MTRVLVGTRALLGIALFAAEAAGQPKQNADAALLAQFEKRLGDYVKVHQAAVAGVPPVKPGHSGAGIPAYQHAVAERIRESRRDAKQGDLFTAEIAGEMRRLIGQVLQGDSGKRVRHSLRKSEASRMVLSVNAPFPERQFLPFVPPTLLLNLPRLPAEVDYRIVGNSLVLRDTAANLVVDYVPDAIAKQP